MEEQINKNNEVGSWDVLSSINQQVIDLFYKLLETKPEDCLWNKIKYSNGLMLEWINSDDKHCKKEYVCTSPFTSGINKFLWSTFWLPASDGEFLTFFITTPLRQYPVPLNLSRIEMAQLKDTLVDIYRNFELHHLDQFLAK